MVSDVLLILVCLDVVPSQIPQLDFHLDMISNDFLWVGSCLLTDFVREGFLTGRGSLIESFSCSLRSRK